MVSVNRILHFLVYLSALVGVLPLLPFLDLWVAILIGAGFLLGMVGDRRGQPLLNNRLVTICSVGFFLLFFTQVSFSNLVNPLINLLCLLLAVRLVSEKSARHMLQLFLLSTMVLASSSMLTLDLAYLLYLVLIVLLVTSGLVLLSFHVTDPQIRFDHRNWSLLLKTTLLLPAGSLLLMMVLFVILPRTQTPLWNFLNPKPTNTIGMTDQVQPGSITELSGSSQVAFRAETKQLPLTALYWRGIVLNRLEGQVWKRAAGIAAEKTIAAPGSEVDLTIYSEPKADRYLVTLDRPIEVKQARIRESVDAVISGRFRENQKISYQVRAQYQSRSQQTGGVTEYLRLPANLSDRVRRTGESIEQGETYQGRRELLDGFFLQQQLSYSTTKLPKTADPIDTFLFESRRGYCEYFASSYAVLLRLAGIPARLVGGYLGGDFNRVGGYYLVGEDAAHVWVEALDDEGIWQRIDPSRLAVNAGEAFAQSGSQGLVTFRAFADAVLHNWSRLVLNYDLRQQFGLIRDIASQVRELKTFELRSLLPLLWGLLGLPPIAVWFLWQQKKTRNERLLRSYRMLFTKSTAVDSLPTDIGLFELAELSDEPLCYRFANIYGSAIYRDEPLSDTDYQQLQLIVSRLKKRKPAIEVAMPTPLGDNGNS